MPDSHHDPMEEGMFGGCDPSEECYQSLDNFVDELTSRDAPTFTCFDLRALAWNVQEIPIHQIRVLLEACGARFISRETPRRIRGFTSNPHDRWFGPGSEPCHGGSGWEQIAGFAGREG